MTSHEPVQKPGSFRGDFLVAEADREPFGRSTGILRAMPDAVAVPEGVADVQSLVRWAAERRVPLVPRAAGTGMPGGNLGPGVAVDLIPGFREPPVVDPLGSVARVAPGITLAELDRAAHPYGLHFPVDPSSGTRCTLGGMLANNSAGAHSVLHGATREWVDALTVVLADGSVANLVRGERCDNPFLRAALDSLDRRLGPEREEILARWPRVRKNSSGYALREYLLSGDAVDLMVGSEGTLGILVGATLRLAPLPRAAGVALLEFTSLEAAGAAVQRLLPHRPATCEMLDRTFLDLVRGAGDDIGYPLGDELEAILLVEAQDTTAQGVADRLAAIRDTATPLASRIALATDPHARERFWHIRHAASPIIAARAGNRVSMQFIEDGVVPVDRLADYVRLLRSLLDRYQLPAVIFGHAGDGNLHVNPLIDVSRPAWWETLEALLEETAHGVATLGGTLAGEHGDGRLRAPYLETVWGSKLFGHFRAVKDALDPHAILNPGVILPLPGQRPFDTLPRDL